MWKFCVEGDSNVLVTREARPSASTFSREKPENRVIWKSPTGIAVSSVDDVGSFSVNSCVKNVKFASFTWKNASRSR